MRLRSQHPSSGRTDIFRALKRAWRRALHDDVSAPDAPIVGLRPLSRREFVTWGATVSAALVGSRGAFAAPRPRSLDVGIVGAGLAGLACADRLAASGFAPAVYEASDRVGGRCYSLRGFFPGQVAERGGEFIDNPHKTMLGYAQRFGLAREDVTKDPGEVAYYFAGQHVDEHKIVDEFRAFVPAMQADLRTLSGEPSAALHTPADEALDRLSLAEYLDSRGASPRAKAAIGEAYLAEYGLELDEQSSLNFLLFIHADRRSKFTPFGVSSDERWHLIGGNDAIALGLASALARPVQSGLALERVARRSDGRIELTFLEARRSVTRVHDAVVLGLPFSVLRTLDLAPSLAVPPDKRLAIDELGYGTNAKMMVGFAGRPWAALGSNGSSYSDLESHQTTWETNPTAATSSRAVLTDYSSGRRGATLNPARDQQEASAFLSDLDLVYPGAFTQATRDSRGRLHVHLEHWPSNPLSRGSYTCYRPGQFTTIAGLEATPVGNVFFAGEHADSFYSWQGFMEGAALSGIAAADALQGR